MTREMERRTVGLRELRVAEGDGDPPRIEGYAAVFDQLSDDLGGFRERIQRGAFAKTLREADVRALWNHDSNYVLGRVRSETLALQEDEQGLSFSVVPPDAQWARDVLVTMRRGDVDQMSFGFWVVRDEWETVEEETIRTLVEVELFDVSPVTFPAYPQTSAEVRAKVEELTAAPGQGPHPADDAEEARSRTRLDILRRRLELEELGS